MKHASIFPEIGGLPSREVILIMILNEAAKVMADRTLELRKLIGVRDTDQVTDMVRTASLVPLEVDVNGQFTSQLPAPNTFIKYVSDLKDLQALQVTSVFKVYHRSGLIEAIWGDDWGNNAAQAAATCLHTITHERRLKALVSHKYSTSVSGDKLVDSSYSRIVIRTEVK